MRIRHKVSKQIITVPNDHGEMLRGQGWEEYEEINHGVQEKRQEASEEVKPKRGRPTK